MYVSPQQVVAAVSNAASMQPVTTSVSACPPPQNNVAAAFNNYAILAANRQQLQPAGLHMAPLLQGPYTPIQHPAALAASIQLQQAAAVQAAQVHALHHNLQHPPPQARQEVPPAVVTQTHSTGEQNYLGLAFRYVYDATCFRVIYFLLIIIPINTSFSLILMKSWKN